MGKYSVFDAFQAAAGATSSVLNSFDEQLKIKAGIEVQDALLQQQEAFHQWTLEADNSNDWRNYEKSWDTFKKKSYNSSMKTLSSPYASRLFTQHFKKMEMTQRITVQKMAHHKMKTEELVKGLDSARSVITAEYFTPQTITNPDGTTRKVSVLEQKKAKITEILHMQYNRGNLSYEELNIKEQEAYAALLKHDFVSQGMALVDAGKSLAEVTAFTEQYEQAFTLSTGNTITHEAIKGKATQQIKAYFREQQGIWYEQNAQQVSQVLTLMHDAINKKQWEKAIMYRDQGRALLHSLDAKYSNDGFSQEKRDYFSRAFSLSDDVLMKGGTAAVGSMSTKQLDAYFKYLQSYGKDDKGKPFTNAALVKYVQNDFLPERAKTQGIPAAMAEAYTIIKSLEKGVIEQADEGVKHMIKNAPALLKSICKEKGLDDVQTMQVVSAGIAQIYDYVETTPRALQRPDDLSRIAMQSVMANTAETTIEKGIGLFSKSVQTQLDSNLLLYGNTKKAKTDGTSLLTDQDISRRDSARGAFIEEFQKAIGFDTKDEVLSAYTISINDSGTIDVIDNDTKDKVFEYKVRQTGVDKHGNPIGEGSLYAISKDTDGGIIRTPLSSLEDIKNSRDKKQIQKQEAYETEMNKLNGKNTTEHFQNEVLKVPREERALFTQIKQKGESEEEILSTYKTLHAINEKYQAGKELLKAVPVPTVAGKKHEGMQKGFIKTYNALKEPYSKALFLQAFDEQKGNGDAASILVNSYDAFCQKLQAVGLQNTLTDQDLLWYKTLTHDTSSLYTPDNTEF